MRAHGGAGAVGVAAGDGVADRRVLVDELAVVLGVGEVLALGHEGAVEQDRAGAEHLAKAFRAGGRRAGERWHRCVACGSSEATACEPMSSVLAGLSQVFARFVARSGGHAQSDCGGLVFRVVAGFALVWAGLVWGMGRGGCFHHPRPHQPRNQPLHLRRRQPLQHHRPHRQLEHVACPGWMFGCDFFAFS